MTQNSAQSQVPINEDLRRFIDEDLARLRDCCAMVKADMESDVKTFEGKPFDGKTVSEMHGNLAAAISACAGMIDRIALAVKDLA